MASVESRRGSAPGRRELLVRAAVEVIERDGVWRLSHRRVAAEAGVPLGSTTYYFDSLDDLLAAALAEFVERDLTAMRQRFAALPPEVDLPALLAEIVCESTGSGRTSAVIVAELYAAALRSEAVREVALAWNAAWLDILESRMTRTAAGAVMALTSGMIERALLERTTLSARAVADQIRIVLGQSDKAEQSGSTAPV